MATRRPQDGRGGGKSVKGGRRANKNTGSCPAGVQAREKAAGAARDRIDKQGDLTWPVQRSESAASGICTSVHISPRMLQAEMLTNNAIWVIPFS